MLCKEEEQQQTRTPMCSQPVIPALLKRSVKNSILQQPNLEKLVQTVKYFLGPKKKSMQNSACICACEISKKCQNLFQSHVAVESQHSCIFLMTHSVGRIWDGCGMKMDK